MTPPSATWRWQRVAPSSERRRVSRSLLRDILGEHTTFRQRCDSCGRGDHGRLAVTTPGVLVAVTYAADIAIVAVLEDSAEVTGFGIDAEPAEALHRDAIGFDGVLWPGASVRDWTRVEAALKADGRGLRVDADEVRIDGSAHGWRAVVPGASAPLQGWDVHDPALGDVPAIVSAAARVR